MVALGRSGADVVAASRYVRGGHQVGGPIVKRTLSRAAGLLLHWVGGLPVHDATSNFRLYSRRLLEGVTIESTAGFEIALELTVKAHLLGMRLAEVPTTWRDRAAGESRFRLWAWLPQYLRWFRRGAVARLAPRPRSPC
jgi:dolichol-phosphate mannosyltransferase